MDEKITDQESLGETSSLDFEPMQAWRNKILNAILLTLVAADIIAFMPGVLVSLKADLITTAIINIAAFLWITCIYFLKKIPYKIRAVNLILLLYLLGMWMTFHFGPHGAGFFILFSFPIITGPLLGLRAGSIALILNSLSLVFFMIATTNGIITWKWSYQTENWLVILTSFVLLNVLSTIAITVLMKGLEKTIFNLKAVNLNLKIVNDKLKDAYIDTIHRLVIAAEYKDTDTGDHVVRISKYSAFIAEKLGLSQEEIEKILYSSPMHDIGKIGIPDRILMKNGKLTESEYDFMKSHTQIGSKILSQSNSGILRYAQQIALYHHEKWNGKGYPDGLSKHEIPLAARIVGLVDVFDTLTSKRPYKDPYPIEIAVDFITKEKGEHFDPELVDILVKYLDDFIKIKEEINPSDDKIIKSYEWSERDRN
ncbi:MAG: HD domain-containing protein [Candidatus Cloacimonetes bacterium]|nr:HD domain-containing protein [Candidatus Cloacimonadota bacterium]